MAICKKIVDLYNGEIWVTSEKEKGSIFHIIFPESMLVDAVVVEEEEEFSSEDDDDDDSDSDFA